MFDPESRTWQPLPDMKHRRAQLGVAAVAGGMVAVGGTGTYWTPEGDDNGSGDDDDDFGPDELYDEESGRWLELPHPMAKPRKAAQLVSVPPAALVGAPGAAAQQP